MILGWKVALVAGGLWGGALAQVDNSTATAPAPNALFGNSYPTPCPRSCTTTESRCTSTVTHYKTTTTETCTVTVTNQGSTVTYPVSTVTVTGEGSIVTYPVSTITVTATATATATTEKE
jgi:hypothetical protein